MSSTCHAGSDGAKGNIGANVQAGDAKGTEDHVLIDCKLLMLEVIIHDSDGLLLSFFKVIAPIKVPVSITDSIMIIRKRLLILMFQL